MDQYFFIQEELHKMSRGVPIELDLKSLFQAELISILIQKVVFSVAEGDILSVNLESFCFENSKNIPKENARLVKFSEGEDVMPLISIVTIGFRIKEIASGSLDGLGVSYEPSRNCLTMYLRNISYEASRKENHTKEITDKVEFSKTDPFKYAKCRSSIHLPDLGPENNCMKKNSNFLIEEDVVGMALQMVFNETDNRLEKVTVKMGKIGVVISSSDISEAITLLMDLTGLYTGERKQLIDELKSTVFLEKIFLEIDNVMNRIAQNQAENVSVHPEDEDNSKLEEPVSYEGYNVLLDVVAEGVSLGFAKDEDVYLNYRCCNY